MRRGDCSIYGKSKLSCCESCFRLLLRLKNDGMSAQTLQCRFGLSQKSDKLTRLL